MARTPSKEAHEKVLAAALRLISERGVEATSMDAIAVEAGVSKATVYKHWPGKDELLLEVIGTMQDTIPDFDSGDPRKDMTDFLAFMAHSKKRAELGRIWPRVISYAIGNPEFGKALQHHSFNPRRRQFDRILKNAVRHKEIRPDVDLDIAIDLLFGPLMRRRFLNEEVPPGWPEQIVGYFWDTFKRR
ncbi:MAG: TetR/AcrR family transcriptional regulator [Acidobacteriota bacterium]|nr:TetR/AcrR family transcriptional regulator [Acidobacteriota bacterium]